MDSNTLPIELERSCDKFDKNQERTVRDFGHGSTVGSLAITQKYIPKLAKAILSELELPTRETYKKQLVLTLRGLSSEVIALSVIQTSLHSIAMGHTLRDTLLFIGRNIASEAWAAKLTYDEPKLAKRIERAVRQRHSNVKYRKQAARSIAARAGYSSKRWSRELTLRAGLWCLQIAIDTLPEVFVLVEGEGGQQQLTITKGALDLADAAMAEVITRNPIFMPLTEPPRPWTGWSAGGSYDERVTYGVSLLRSRFKDTQAETKGAIRSGQMAPALDAINALQRVPFTINMAVFNAVVETRAFGFDIPGLPPLKDIPAPEKEKPWEKMTEAEQRLWKYRAHETEKANRGYMGERLLWGEDKQTARAMAAVDKFYIPMNMDWRGRIYAMCHFNFQREDRVRSLFLFADGEPIGAEGIEWLKVHVANCGDFGKVSKRPLAERIEWTNSHLSMLRSVASAPVLKDPDFIGPTQAEAWLRADKPCLFLASCMELEAALRVGPSFVTRLPISFDGTCSGLQHLSAMTRAEEGALVNLVPGLEPQDVYENVATLVRERLEDDDRDPCATMALAYGVDRKLVKRNVMTYTYSSKKYGMADQLREDVMAPLQRDVLAGKLDEHPFGYDNGFVASKYLASHIFDGIEEVVKLPAKAMSFLQTLAKVMAHEGKPLRWTTPTGLPWINRYHAPETKRVVLWMHDKGVKLRYDVKLAVGDAKPIDKDKAANGVAPNFVHACDAAHLMLTVNAAVREDTTQLATVHDSFGCLASRAGRFVRIIREQFAEMYLKHDVLTEVLEQAKCDLTQHNWHRLPEVPQFGSLNLMEITNAEYAFA